MVAKKSSRSAVSSKAKPVEDKSTDKGADEKVKTTNSMDKAVVKKKKKNLKSRPVAANVIYVGHIPEGCEERELIGFLKQFGILTQLRLCRSHKTGGSKGYAFAKFQSPEVAAIVADTLNGHLLFKKKLISHVLAPEQIHSKLFAAKTRTVFQRKSAKRDAPKSMEKMEEISKRLIEREQSKRDNLKAMGINYDFPGYLGAKKKLPGNTLDGEANGNGNDSDEKEEKPAVKKSKKASTPTSAKSSAKKRKHSFDGDKQSPEASTKDTETSQSEKKKKKSKKKDKKRRKSA